jgi:hypothetical protein
MTTKNKKGLGVVQDFEITSVCLADLEQQGFDVSNVDDATMKRLASKMSDAYCEQNFWSDLDIIAEHLGIKKQGKRYKRLTEED